MKHIISQIDGIIAYDEDIFEETVIVTSQLDNCDEDEVTEKVKAEEIFNFTVGKVVMQKVQ